MICMRESSGFRIRVASFDARIHETFDKSKGTAKNGQVQCRADSGVSIGKSAFSTLRNRPLLLVILVAVSSSSTKIMGFPVLCCRIDLTTRPSSAPDQPLSSPVKANWPAAELTSTPVNGIRMLFAMCVDRAVLPRPAGPFSKTGPSSTVSPRFADLRIECHAYSVARPIHGNSTWIFDAISSASDSVIYPLRRTQPITVFRRLASSSFRCAEPET